MKRGARVLVVDDSALMRRMISRILTSAGFEVVGTARDGEEGLKAVGRLLPDVVTLDVEMPGMDGLTMLRRLMRERPTPVVMVSSLTQAQAPATVEALALGAVDAVAKPGGNISLNLDEVAQELIDKVRAAARAKAFPLGEASHRDVPALRPARAAALTPSRAEMVVVGCSTGGPRALTELVSRLPADFGAPIVIVQHMLPGFTASLAERLGSVGALAAAEAIDGVKPEPGQIWVAPGGRHLLFDGRGRMRLDDGPPHLGVRPAADLTMESAVDAWADKVIGVVLTGMGMDGAKGARRIKRAGGRVIAQDEATSAVYGMPRAVVEMGLADRVEAIEDVAGALVSMTEAARVGSG